MDDLLLEFLLILLLGIDMFFDDALLARIVRVPEGLVELVFAEFFIRDTCLRMSLSIFFEGCIGREGFVVLRESELV